MPRAVDKTIKRPRVTISISTGRITDHQKGLYRRFWAEILRQAKDEFLHEVDKNGKSTA